MKKAFSVVLAALLIVGCSKTPSEKKADGEKIFQQAKVIIDKYKEQKELSLSDPDKTEIEKLLSAAANLGNEKALLTLAYGYIEGQIKNDPQKGLELLKNGSRNGMVLAKLELASMYDKGRIVPRDDRESFRLKSEAAQTGNTLGLIDLADMYRDGKGCTKDINKALELYYRAAMMGSFGGQMSLATHFEFADKPDYIKAYAWYNVAATRDDSPSRFVAQRRDEIEKSLSPQELQQAQDLTREIIAAIEKNKTK